MEDFSSPQLSFIVAAYAIGAGALIGLLCKTLRDLAHLRALECAAGPTQGSGKHG